MNALLVAIQANPLTAVVLVALVVGELAALALMARTAPLSVAALGWHSGVGALWAVLGLPAILDLLRASGFPLVLAAVALVVLVLQIVLPLLAFTPLVTQPLVARWPDWAVPVLVVGGVVVAGYLTYVDVTATVPVCGPVINGCHVVQASPYSKLFGVVPVALLGLLGYLVIFIGWLLDRRGPASVKKFSRLGIWVVCFFGVIFSAYLTYLELGVILATCDWCLTSAVLMLLLLWVSTPAAQAVFVSAADED
jgi:uncharacterized membrane protein